MYLLWPNATLSRHIFGYRLWIALENLHQVMLRRRRKRKSQRKRRKQEKPPLVGLIFHLFIAEFVHIDINWYNPIHFTLFYHSRAALTGSKPQISRILTGFTDYYVGYGQTEPPTRPVAGDSLLYFRMSLFFKSYLYLWCRSIIIVYLCISICIFDTVQLYSLCHCILMSVDLFPNGGFPIGEIQPHGRTKYPDPRSSWARTSEEERRLGKATRSIYQMILVLHNTAIAKLHSKADWLVYAT